MTRGRVAPDGEEIDLVAFVVSTVSRTTPRIHLQPEHLAIVAAAWEPISVVELAANLDLSIGVVRVLLGDLRSAGLIAMYEPPASLASHDVDVLKAVVNGLRAL
jgi:DNA-binding transcriptional ArsR family regulator